MLKKEFKSTYNCQISISSQKNISIDQSDTDQKFWNQLGLDSGIRSEHTINYKSQPSKIANTVDHIEKCHSKIESYYRKKMIELKKNLVDQDYITSQLIKQLKNLIKQNENQKKQIKQIAILLESKNNHTNVNVEKKQINNKQKIQENLVRPTSGDANKNHKLKSISPGNNKVINLKKSIQLKNVQKTKHLDLQNSEITVEVSKKSPKHKPNLSPKLKGRLFSPTANTNIANILLKENRGLLK